MSANSATVYEHNGMLHYPFPLSTGQIATFDIPVILTAEDAERLSKFVLGLAAETAEMSFPRVITWVDSCVQNDQVDKDDFPKPCMVTSFGFVVEDTHDYVTLARDDVGDGDYRGLISIPRIAITETKP